MAAGNQIVVTPELRALLEANPKPKIVIRVPNPPANVTEAEKFGIYINQIERAFLQASYTVRDRALLENLLRTSSTDYQSIRRTIDTDLIIDILALEFSAPEPYRQFHNRTEERDESFARPENFVGCPKAKLECRLTIVDKGQLGGLFTVFASPCDQQDYEFLVKSGRDLMRWPTSASPGWSPSLSVVFDSVETQRIFTEHVANELIKQLVAR